MEGKGDWSDEFVHHWKYYTNPARPSNADLEFIKKQILNKGENPAILVLGSTPEYRNLCGEIGIKVTLIDFKKYNFDYLTDEVKNLTEEDFIEGNWITTVLDKKFDIILADNVINVLTKEDLPALLSNVSKMLKADGWFLPRTYIRTKDDVYTAKKAIEEYHEKYPEVSFCSGTVIGLFLAVYDYEKELTCTKDVYEEVLKLHKEKVISDKEFQEVKNLSWNRNFTFFIPEKEFLDKSFAELFLTEDVFYSKEAYLKDRLPLHKLRLL